MCPSPTTLARFADRLAQGAHSQPTQSSRDRLPEFVDLVYDYQYARIAVNYLISYFP
jgi:hypothetical protein